ncbi:WD-40 repeat protein [Reticulomyxa filosa]|uniref:WD-40 repeat protein n=1 Tax=Reticulomyxa filosa TaxID=46433 RepID=X6PAG6_RETFI|nr:WD-40 repeat protein [Reticulomyxa filosa]|eukprot:ETO35123.1 WD-40 repeat protein [Reticulomyxa filosa]
MANRTTTKKTTERQTKQSQHINTSTPFQSLKDLPVPLSQSQCVPHKHEILICGGKHQRKCYSYHTIKNEYKFICEYPTDVYLEGHCVVKLVDNNNKDSNQITLLSFGGKKYRKKYTLVMKYVSVWSNENEMNESRRLEKSNNYNKWVPFADDHNHPIIIGRDNDDYQGMRAMISGSNNNLLFITYYENNISVFDLNTFQFIKHETLPTKNGISFHCLVSKSENGQEMKKNYGMLLFCFKTGLSIEYDEDNNTFQCHQLPVCDDIALLYQYAYVCINDSILFFGGYGWNGNKWVVSESVHKYSIEENKWTTFEDLPSPLESCVAILSEDNTHVHIIGGIDDKKITLSTHMKTKVRVWDIPQLVIIKFVIQHWIRILKIKLGWINDFDKIVINYVKGYELLMVLQGHRKSVSSVRFSADGHKIISASYDHTVRIWDVLSGKQLQIFTGHTAFVFTARFLPDGYTIVSCSGDGTIRLWNINTGNEVMKLERDFDQIWDVDISPDGKYIISGLRDKTIRTEIKQFLGHSKGVSNTQFSPDGKTIVSSSNDKIINLWNVESGEILKQFKGHSDGVMRARFSPDGKFIVSCSFDNTIRIWDIETEKELKILKGHTKGVNDVKYFLDGQTIISCSSDNTIQLWDIESGNEIQMLKGHSHSVKLQLFYDGRIFYIFVLSHELESITNLTYLIFKSNRTIFKKSVIFTEILTSVRIIYILLYFNYETKRKRKFLFENFPNYTAYFTITRNKYIQSLKEHLRLHFLFVSNCFQNPKKLKTVFRVFSKHF